LSVTSTHWVPGPTVTRPFGRSTGQSCSVPSMSVSSVVKIQSVALESPTGIETVTFG
jgi:hypothetical protein